MKAVVCNGYGAPDSLHVGSLDLPELEPGCVRVRVLAAGINFPDTLIIRGAYQLRPAFPFAPGFEAAGKVIACGKGVEEISIGTRVVGLTAAGYGAFAEYADIRAAECLVVPHDISDETAVALYTAYGTAYHALVQRGGLTRGDKVVVLGATGGVGLAAVDIASSLGADVIAVGSSAQKLGLAERAGASSCVVYEPGGLSDAVRTATGGSGADICVDLVGGSATSEMSRAMAWEGRLLIIGFASGEIPSLPANILLLKGYDAVGVYWGRFVERDPAGNASNFERIWDLLRRGEISPHIHSIRPMEQAAHALQELLDRTVVGKQLLSEFAA